MRTCMDHILTAVGLVCKQRLNCVYPCNPAGPAFDSKHPHLPRNEDLLANPSSAADRS